MRLKKMTRYTKQQMGLLDKRKITIPQLLNRLANYCAILLMKNKLNYFMPCDNKGNVIVKPNIDDYSRPTGNGTGRVLDENRYIAAMKKYNDALSWVIFKGEWTHTRDDRYTFMNWLKDERGNVIKVHDCLHVEDLTQYDFLVFNRNGIKMIEGE